MFSHTLLTLLALWLISFAGESTTGTDSVLNKEFSQPGTVATCSPTPVPLPASFMFYVDNKKSGPSDGSEQMPFHTISEALTYVQKQRQAGGSLATQPEIQIKVFAGADYVEPPLMITEAGIKLVGEPGDGPKPKIVSGASSIVTIMGANILFHGFKLTNGSDFIPFIDNDKGSAGINVMPSSSDITISNNEFETIGVKYPGDEDKYGQSHGINVRSYDGYDKKKKKILTPSQPIRRVSIIGNTLSQMHLGRSEGIAINGNVSDVLIWRNNISELDNIAIDIGGFQEEGPKGSRQKWQAQDVVVMDNVIHDIYASLKHDHRHYNPGQIIVDAKTKEKLIIMVGAIYVDGGTIVTIDRNTVYDSAIAIDVGSEYDATVKDVKVKNNLAYHNRSAGIKIADGGSKVIESTFANNALIDNNYPDAENGPKHDNGSLYFGRGYVCGIVVANNLISGADGKVLLTNLAEVPLQCTFPNAASAAKPKPSSKQKCEEGAVCTVRFIANGFSGDQNRFHNVFTWTSFKEHYGSQAIEFQPFELKDFKPTAASPARDKGEQSGYPDCDKCCLDRDGNSRIVNNKIDVGAFEFQE